VKVYRFVKRRSSHIFYLDNRNTDGGVVIRTSLPGFTAQEDAWYSFPLKAVNVRDILVLEGLGNFKKDPITSSEFEIVTFRVEA
jgi:hypothetical protein